MFLPVLYPKAGHEAALPVEVAVKAQVTSKSAVGSLIHVPRGAIASERESPLIHVPRGGQSLLFNVVVVEFSSPAKINKSISLKGGPAAASQKWIRMKFYRYSWIP